MDESGECPTQWTGALFRLGGVLGLVTADVAASHDPDLLPLALAMEGRFGREHVRIVSWDDASVDWTQFDAVVIRSTWDYSDRLDEFVAWVDAVDAATTLVNGADVVRWSTDKHYLEALQAEGVPIVPTVFVAPGEAVAPVDGLHVVKPAVGAGANGAKRCMPDEVVDHVAFLHGQGRVAMIQPYLDLLDERGETEHCFVVGGDGHTLRLSHAFRKGALLAGAGVERTGDLFATETISSRRPSADELALAEAVLATDTVTALGDIVFARVDVAPYRDDHGVESFVLMELELIEPSFFFQTNPATVDVFADGLANWLARRGLVPGARSRPVTTSDDRVVT